MKICKRAYRALVIDSYGRFDLRLTPGGEIFIIEANANPALTMDDELAESAYQSLMKFLEEEDIVTVKPYFGPALHEKLGAYVPVETRNFFAI